MEDGESPTLLPYDNFLFALKAESSRRQYPRNLEETAKGIRLSVHVYANDRNTAINEPITT